MSTKSIQLTFAQGVQKLVEFLDQEVERLSQKKSLSEADRRAAADLARAFAALNRGALFTARHILEAK